MVNGIDITLWTNPSGAAFSITAGPVLGSKNMPFNFTLLYKSLILLAKVKLLPSPTPIFVKILKVIIPSWLFVLPVVPPKVI